MKKDSIIKLNPNFNIKLNDEIHNSILIVGNFYGFFGDPDEEGFLPNLSKCSKEIVDMIIWMFIKNKDAKHVFIGTYDKVGKYLRNLRKTVTNLFGINIKEDNWIEYLVKEDSDQLNILNKVKEEMPKFDYIIQNPPYNKNLHIQFFNKGLDMLGETGKMTIIEPATWLMNLKENTPNVEKLFKPLKERVNGKVEKIIIENLNGEFGTMTTVPFSITYINNKFNGNTNLTLFGTNQTIKFDNCSHILDNDLVYSILDKIKNYDKVCNHLTDNKEGYYYLRKNDIVYPVYGEYFISYTYFNNKNRFYDLKYGNYHLALTSSCLNGIDDIIYDKIPYGIARGKGPGGKFRLSNKRANCIYGAKEQLTNYKHYVLNNTLPLFINICMTIDQHNNSLKYVPWLVDKQYTDQEIYDMFKFTQKEINLIEKTIRKFEHYSPFFKRAMCGPSSASDQEVQEFCDKLDKEFPTE